jgi:hypothetical protein
MHWDIAVLGSGKDAANPWQSQTIIDIKAIMA